MHSNVDYMLSVHKKISKATTIGMCIVVHFICSLSFPLFSLSILSACS